MTRADPTSTVAPPPQGDLARLLETEQRLEERLRAARAEAEALVAQARRDAETRDAALAAEIAAEEKRVADALETERRRREAEIAADAEREALEYERAPAALLSAVARALADRIGSAP